MNKYDNQNNSVLDLFSRPKGVSRIWLYGNYFMRYRSSDFIMKTVMVIPSYWSREKSVGWKKQDAIYDHPTPLDEQGTLKRMLESINVLENKDFDLIILAVPTNEEISNQVQEKVTDIVSSVSLDLNISVIGSSHIEQVKEYLNQSGKKDLARLISINGYSNIRNLCLFLPAIKDADVAILIDDDEVFTDPLYLSKALEHIKNPFDDRLQYAIAGYYVNSDGNYQVNSSFSSWMKFWDKKEKMNEAFDQIIGKSPRMKITPFVFGGNMIIPKEVFSTIMFDPYVPRGEDIDYLINARMHNIPFYLDNQLFIVHLPPSKSHPTWQRLREDIFRFMYERKKIHCQKGKKTVVQPEDLDPYPGCFLKKDLDDKIKKANDKLAEEYRLKGDHQGEKQALNNIKLAESEAIPKFDPVDRYERLRNQWMELIRMIQNPSVKKKLEDIIDQ